MNKIIRIKKKKLSNKVNIIGGIFIVFMIFAVFFLREFSEITYFISALAFFIFIIIVSYKIRYYLDLIVISDNKISIEYLSKSFFRQKPFTCNIQDIDIRKEKKKIILSIKNKIVAVIINDSINKEDREILTTCFEKKVL